MTDTQHNAPSDDLRRDTLEWLQDHYKHVHGPLFQGPDAAILAAIAAKDIRTHFSRLITWTSQALENNGHATEG